MSNRNAQECVKRPFAPLFEYSGVGNYVACLSVRQLVRARLAIKFRRWSVFRFDLSESPCHLKSDMHEDDH